MSEIKCAYELLTTFLNSCMSIVFYPVFKKWNEESTGA